MLSLGSGNRYHLWRGAVDMRKGMDALSGLVREYFKGDPMSGDVYIFINGTRNQIKLLRWDDTGFVIYWKRLERGRFEIPKISADSTDYTISWGKLQLVLEGIEEGSVRWKKRYSYGSGGK